MAIFDKQEISSKKKEIDQYLGIGSFDENDDPYRELEKVSPYVGEILLAFSNLEHSLELAISGIVSDRSDEPGMFLIKFLADNRTKIEYFSEATRQFIAYTDQIRDKDKPKALAELKRLVKVLNTHAEIRNIIAHSKWNTITKDFYVANSTKLNKTTGRVEIELYQLRPKVLCAIITGINITNDSLWKFIDKVHLR